MHVSQHPHPETENCSAGQMQETVFIFYLLYGIVVSNSLLYIISSFRSLTEEVRFSPHVECLGEFNSTLHRLLSCGWGTTTNKIPLFSLNCTVPSQKLM
jgi:hypothetical protein